MKFTPYSFCLCLALSLLYPSAAPAQTPTDWLTVLNAMPNRAEKLSPQDVLFHPSQAENFPGLVTVGYRQSDGRYVLGNLIWEGKVWTPLAGYGQILASKRFQQATDEERTELFSQLLRQTSGKLGTHPYSGDKSRESNRPQPILGQRQVDGQHRFVVWFCEEPGEREGPEWRQVLYLLSSDGQTVKARTLDTYHPSSEDLRGFPPIPSESYE